MCTFEFRLESNILENPAGEEMFHFKNDGFTSSVESTEFIQRLQHLYLRIRNLSIQNK